MQILIHLRLVRGIIAPMTPHDAQHSATVHDEIVQAQLLAAAIRDILRGQTLACSLGAVGHVYLNLMAHCDTADEALMVFEHWVTTIRASIEAEIQENALRKLRHPSRSRPLRRALC